MSKYAHNIVSDADKNTPWYKMMQWMGEGETVLDIGCSSGYFGEKLIAAKGDKVWGIDLDKDDATAAKKRGYEEVYVGDLDNFDWSVLGNLKFDSIIYADVLEHVKDPLACVIAARKLLKPGGTLYASIPNIAHITVRMELFEGNFDYESTGLLDNTHIRFFTRKTVWQMFEDAGMKIVHDDRTINDVPDGQVKHHLEQLGLKATEVFEKWLHDDEGRTFQYIVGAQLASTDVPSAPKPVLTAKLHDDWPKIEKKMQDDDAHIRQLEAELNAVRTELASARQHPVGWVVKKGIKKLKKSS